jgi:hypothetical protein
MKRVMIVLALVVAVVVGIGFYRQWFSVASDKADDKSHVTLSADSAKFKDDEKKVVAKVEALGTRAKDKAVAPTEKTKEQTTAPMQPSEGAN